MKRSRKHQHPASKPAVTKDDLLRKMASTRATLATKIDALPEDQRADLFNAIGEYVAAGIALDRFLRPTRASVYRDALRALNG